ncbi:MAG: hypothetical protein EWV45_10790 [Microcystis flos-aquae Mf_QC_C_20070823_S10D]|uniref:DUF5615 domain-containing protein n=1 Tax=Microcystis flos-aquae Mf_QC_C_20070823_S10D TaxID=2486236 RepID=A0A552KV14_9CHRO|nr:MAG: hypothetical protein EWV65_00640 [Microcystis flos-aquae Ma_QC_C_20070823_S18D]TRV11793.1 MAG: hypothetical protein EWV45_10790 [Microcystis flos-aquae Mf_QC_C_20070823_S10D]TRV24125.1 MAG: hypothetical protein EWV72_12110 [Microcystis flos-aquae Mf_QC_C_20070823_S10]TRV30147.1 MAG: hypothetical protein EWV70_19905 [Microcystis flos-aquae Mf_QC_C_20070823_S20]TRV33133.1 MAG: hypothetical protein EWV71_17015 [Microcystis flos-aquae Mf_QC_C_20070823_S20D]TRV39508.1 MAG: hypothetical prot
MTIWVDAHLSPAIATWISTTLEIEAVALRDLGLRDAEDTGLFVTWYGSIGGHKLTKSLSGKRLN